MTTFDLSPLLRSSVGFDAFDNIFDSVFNMNESGSTYPPYNIVKSENNYTITLAVAGFSMSDLDISVQENELIISCLLYTSPSPRDRTRSRMPSSA